MRSLARRGGLAVVAVASGIALAACGGGGPKSPPKSTLPPLPPQFYGVVTLIGAGSSAGTGNMAQRIDLSSLPPELLPPTTVGTFPDAVGIAPDDKFAYVTNYQSNTLTPIDLADGKPERPIPAGPGPADVAISPDGETAYVTDAGTSPIGDTVTPIDLKTKKALAPITVGSGPQAIAITPDGRFAYVTDAGAVVTGQSGAIGDTVTPIDLKTRTALAPITVGNGPIAIVIDGDVAYVANSGSESVSPVDLSSRTAAAAIAISGVPEALAVSSTGVLVGVSKGSDVAGEVVPIDTSTNTAGTPITVGKAPTAIAASGAKAWVVCATSIVPMDLSATPSTGSPIAVANGPYALALYPARSK